MTIQEIDGVVDALSRTITELRQAKEKLAKAEAVNASNVEIKRNLALRINELQKELDTVQNKAAKEVAEANRKHERDREAYERFISRALMFTTPNPETIRFAPSRNFISSRSTYFGSEYMIQIPASVFRFTVDAVEMLRWESYVPFLRESVCRKIGNDVGEYVRNESLKILKEIK